jgi:Repeat of unknown function (DUF5648)
MKRLTMSSARACMSLLTLAAMVVPTAHAGTVRAVEYYHQFLEHFFVTASAAEIEALDDRVIPGWLRTGQRYRVHDDPAPDRSPVCRFTTGAFAGKSTHFYTASAAECVALQANPDWVYEGVVFHVRMPDAAGACPTGTTAVERLYNAGRGGAPNHAYTVDPAKRDSLVALGDPSEGVAFCAPLAEGDPAARLDAIRGTSWNLPPGYVTSFGTATLDASEASRMFAAVGVPPAGAAVRRSIAPSIAGLGTWSPLSGDYIATIDHGGPDGDWAWEWPASVTTFESATGPSVATRTCTIIQNLFYGGKYEPNPHQPLLWYGCAAGVANRL